MFKVSQFRKAGCIAITLLLATATVTAQTLFVYPAKGQSAQQQQKDIAECSNWARANTGGPSYGSSAPPPQQQSGGGLRGALGGAAIGAMIGDSSDAGKGAAIGALFGGIRQSRSNQQAQQQYQQQQAQQAAAQQENYNRAYAACLEGRGYTVK